MGEDGVNVLLRHLRLVGIADIQRLHLLRVQNAYTIASDIDRIKDSYKSRTVVVEVVLCLIVRINIAVESHPTAFPPTNTFVYVPEAV